MPPSTLGVLCVKYLGLPGSTRSGENARKKSSSGLRPACTNSGSSASRVKPGNVVLSRTISCGRFIRAASISAASMMNELSGSLVLLSGVGTQMMMTSAAPSTSGSADPVSVPALTSGSSVDDGTSLMYETPLLRSCTFSTDLS